MKHLTILMVLFVGQVSFGADIELTDGGQAKIAGIQAGDVIVGLGGKRPDMDVIGFVDHVQRTYLIGETIVVNVLRNGQPLDLPMKLLK